MGIVGPHTLLAGVLKAEAVSVHPDRALNSPV